VNSDVQLDPELDPVEPLLDPNDVDEAVSCVVPFDDPTPMPSLVAPATRCIPCSMRSIVAPVTRMGQRTIVSTTASVMLPPLPRV
jgi:hypothetical protein